MISSVYLATRTSFCRVTQDDCAYQYFVGTTGGTFTSEDTSIEVIAPGNGNVIIVPIVGYWCVVLYRVQWRRRRSGSLDHYCGYPGWFNITCNLNFSHHKSYNWTTGKSILWSLILTIHSFCVFSIAWSLDTGRRN